MRNNFNCNFNFNYTWKLLKDFYVPHYLRFILYASNCDSVHDSLCCIFLKAFFISSSMKIALEKIIFFTFIFSLQNYKRIFKTACLLTI